MKKLHILALTAASVSAVQAVTLARWTPVSTALPKGPDYDASTDTPAPDEVAPNVIVSNLDRVGAAAGGTNTGDRWSGTATDGAAGISLGDYTSFSIAPDGGYLVDFTSIAYTFETYGLSDTGGYLTYLRSSLDGFASDLATDSIPAAGPRGGTMVFDISSLTDIDESVEFRIYASAPTSIGGARWFDLIGSDTATDLGLIVDGEVTAIPEPSTGILSGLACLGLAFRRRR